MIAVGVVWLSEDLFRNRFVRGASFYLGRISYSVYLFHLIVIMALKPLLATAPLALQLAIYVAAILALSTRLLCRIRAADPGGAALLRRRAARSAR